MIKNKAEEVEVKAEEGFEVVPDVPDEEPSGRLQLRPEPEPEEAPEMEMPPEAL